MHGYRRHQEEIHLLPSEIRFSQDSIHNLFQDGGRVNALVEDLQSGRTELNRIPLISVVKLDNKYYSMDNRRLYVFRVLQKRGVIGVIKVRLATRYNPQKFTTENDGYRIRVRRDKTHPHTFDDIFGWVDKQRYD